MRGLAGGAGISVLAASIAAVSFRHVGDREASASPVDPGGERPDRGSPAPDDPCSAGERLLGEFRALYGQRHPFRHLIVIAPDPVELGTSELLDLVIEGIEEAASRDEGDGKAYVRDHGWLPWSDAPAEARCWEKQPGVGVFRPLDGPDRQPPLLVLFVGETPIWGLRTAQFDAAMDIVERHGTVSGPAGSPFLVLGPTYSGTASSLSAAIRRSSLRDRRFRIVSGTATTVKARQILETPDGQLPRPGTGHRVARDPCARVPPASGLVSFESASATDTCLLKKMEEFLVARGGACDRDGEGNMVLFTETSTTYGSVGSELESGADKPCFRRWKLPPDLGAIRRSFAKQDDEKEEKGAGGEDRSEVMDGVVEQPTKVAGHSLALGSTLDRLSNGRIRFAGIIAADHRDVLFLARRFRQELPDIRLFTLGASIHYQDERSADALNGMLVVHSAPGDRNHSMALQNELVRKIYYAGRKLLAGEEFEPEVRVSFIGNGRLWQIDDFGRAPRRHLPWPVGWQVTFAFFFVLFVGVVIVVALGARKACSRPRGRLWALVAPCMHADLRRQDRSISAALLLVSAGPLVLMLESMFARQGRTPDHWLLCAVAAVLTVGLSWFLYIDGRRATAFTGVATRGRWRRFSALLPMAVPTVVVALALYAGCGPERRATLYLLSGGSPVLPGLIALGSYSLALVCARMRLRMLDTHRLEALAGERFFEMSPPIAEALGEVRGQKTGLADVEYRLLVTLYHPWKYARVVPAGIHLALAFSLGLPMFIKPPHTLEPGWRNAALISLGIVAALTASINLAWFLTTWARFIRFARRLACFPAIAALEKLPDRRARRLEEQLAWSGSEGIQLVQVVENLGRVADADESVRETYRECRALLETKLSTEATRRKAGGAELIDLLLATSSRLSANRDQAPRAKRARIDDFAASLVDLFIPRYVRHFPLFIPPMVLGCLLSFFLLSLYFVQPQRLIASVALFWVAVTVVVVLLSYVSLDVDRVLSAIGGSKAGKVTSWFALARRIVLWSAVPVASYLAVENPQFPLWVSNLLEFIGKSLR